jgi:hypothetical protein
MTVTMLPDLEHDGEYVAYLDPPVRFPEKKGFEFGGWPLSEWLLLQGWFKTRYGPAALPSDVKKVHDSWPGPRPGIDTEKKQEKPVENNSCNRHDNCDEARKTWLLNHPTEKFTPAGFHCHDDECEDCFGS